MENFVEQVFFFFSSIVIVSSVKNGSGTVAAETRYYTLNQDFLSSQSPNHKKCHARRQSLGGSVAE
jgi:hypothetical protein